MKRALALFAFCLALGSVPALAEAPVKNNECDKPNTVKQDDGTCAPIGAAPAATPGTVLPGGALPVGAATNLVFLAPAVAGALGVAALAGGGGGGTNSTTSTTK